jgi:hypothetical protein
MNLPLGTAGTHSFRTVDAEPLITRCGTLNKHAISRG